VTRRALFALLLSIAGGAMAAAPAPVVVNVMQAPQAVRTSDGVRRFYYELDILNYYADGGTLALTDIAVYGDDDSAPLASFSGAALAQLLPPNRELEADNSLAIKSGGHALVLIAAPTSRPVATLRHKLTFRNDKGVVQIADDIPVTPTAAPPTTIGPPLRGGVWLADEGPGHAQSHHWGSVVAGNGRATIPQRYAIDFFGLDAQGHAVKAPIEKLAQTTVADWIGWNAEVVAVADGVVRDLQDNVAERKPLSPQEQPEELSTRSLYGNFVVLEIAPHVYAHYAHLRDGSIKVKPGQRVKRGEALGSLGLTGGAGAPHLHFHLADKPTFADSQGLPFVFDVYTPIGHASESDALNQASTIRLAPKAAPLRQRMPVNGDIIGFQTR
jgi:hypothetical protein